jgi:N-acetylglucosaminyldiphosphoundecaprenol N-acetyl-beta-D-mannosaminyltransferase
MRSTQGNLEEYAVVGVRVHLVEMHEAIEEMIRRIEQRYRGQYVAVTGMHGISEASRNPQFKEILNRASLVVPDGMPLVWVARFHGFSQRHRVCGAELMQEFCRTTGSRFRHFFYGGAPGVGEDLAQQLSTRFGIQVAGTYTPPFRPLTKEEAVEVRQQVALAAADILWVGLSTPKQERWMADHGPQLDVALLVGCGAAFDMNSGRLRRAPVWMQKSGTEWVFRLLQDPRRLWRRYLVAIPEAAWIVALELLRIRKFPKPNRTKTA